jgi:8-hydroxy-5-deazaflavin:NADPH oxidoreductase
LVIDPSNPLDFAGGTPALAIGYTDSAGELVQRLLPQSQVVKAFNIITAAHALLERPQ